MLLRDTIPAYQIFLYRCLKFLEDCDSAKKKLGKLYDFQIRTVKSLVLKVLLDDLVNIRKGGRTIGETDFG